MLKKNKKFLNFIPKITKVDVYLLHEGKAKKGEKVAL